MLFQVLPRIHQEQAGGSSCHRTRRSLRERESPCCTSRTMSSGNISTSARRESNRNHNRSTSTTTYLEKEEEKEEERLQEYDGHHDGWIRRKGYCQGKAITSKGSRGRKFFQNRKDLNSRLLPTLLVPY